MGGGGGGWLYVTFAGIEPELNKKINALTFV